MAAYLLRCFHVEGHRTAEWTSWLVAPLHLLFRAVASWQFAVVALVLQQGRHDPRFPEEQTPAISRVPAGEAAQGSASIQEIIATWLGAQRIVALVPVGGMNPEKARRRATPRHGTNSIYAGDIRAASGGFRHGQFLRMKGATSASQENSSVPTSTEITAKQETIRPQTGGADVIDSSTKPKPSIRLTSREDIPSKTEETAAGGDLEAAMISLQSEDFIIQPSPEMWLCRLSTYNGPCGWRSFEDIPSGRSCVPEECCSKTYCRLSGQCSNWCINNGFLCLIKDSDYSYGKCSCSNYVHLCDPNAECRDRPQPFGGAFCQCHEGFYGDGHTCKPDPCRASPCLPGDCRRAADGSSSYTCACPQNYVAETNADGVQACTPEANICLTEPCGPEGLDCVSFNDGYECLCNDGYIFKGTTCVKIDWCIDDPCGPPEAVHACSSNLLDYTCFCREGYAVVTGEDGEQRCRKDLCGDNSCGPPELVKSCRILTDETGDAVDYKCVCTDIATPEQGSKKGHPVCKLRDLCADDPCGTEEAAIRCYVKGYSYQCECQPGYSPQQINGRTRCIRGDPCSMGACGQSALVAECLTDGIGYTCSCVTGKAFLTRRSGGESEYCEDLSVCSEGCGDLIGLDACFQDDHGEVDCKCRAGYVKVTTDAGPSCVEGDICTTGPCGPPEAVRECVANTEDTYSCLCNEAFELRYISDTKPVCAALNSCVGHPCGDAHAVEECIEGRTSYECVCKPPYSFKRTHKGGKCRLESGDAAAPETPHAEASKSEGGQLSLWTLTACAGAGVFLLLLVGSGAVFKKSSVEEEDISDEVNIFYFPAQQPHMLHPTSVPL